MSVAATTDLLRLLGDTTRVRLLALLAHEELTVAELTAATEIGQSRVSTHLGKLREAGLVRDRRVGSSSFYSIDGSMPERARALWEVMVGSLEDAVLDQDRQRAAQVVAARDGGLTWADSVAGHMQRHYSPGRTWEATLRGLLGLCRLGDVLDVASGDGALAELVARRARSVTCLDRSERVIEAARARLGHHDHLRFVVGDMHELPLDTAFDQVMLMNCLTYSERPRNVIAEAARVLRPGGSLVGVTLAEHDHPELVAKYNHLVRGFSPAALQGWLSEAGLEVECCQVTSREKRAPQFQVVTFHACLPEGASP